MVVRVIRVVKVVRVSIRVRIMPWKSVVPDGYLPVPGGYPYKPLQALVVPDYKLIIDSRTAADV